MRPLPTSPRPVSSPYVSTKGRWSEPHARSVESGRARRCSAILTAVFGVLLIVGMVKLATEGMAAAAPVDRAGQGQVGVAQEETGGAGAETDPCPGPGLVPIGDTGLCTHGSDEPPPGGDVTSDGDSGISGSAAPPPIDCVGDGRSGKRVQVLYARASDVPSRLNVFRSDFQTVAAEANQIYRDSAAETGGRRSIRFVHDADCRIDVREVVLSPVGDDTFYDMVYGLEGGPYKATNRKYLVFMDAHEYCGIASLSGDDRRDAANEANHTTGYSRIDAACWDLPSVVAHELMHNIGGVQLSAPNSTLYGHCIDEYDVMCYEDGPETPNMRYDCLDVQRDFTLFDCGHDDYFHTSPPAGSYLATRWNSANSQFLIDAVDQPVLPPPVNDDIANAIRASTRPFVDGQVISTATTAPDDPQPACLPYVPSATVWYRTTPTSSGRMSIDAVGRGFNTVVSVWTGTRGSLRSVACAVEYERFGATSVGFSATAGTTYHIMVGSADSWGVGDVKVTLTGPGEGPPPAQLTLSKDKSKYNGSVEASVSGLKPNSSVTLRWPREYEITSGPDDGQLTSLLDSATTDAQGRATFAFRTPLEPYGDYEVAARDPSGGKAVATLRVIPRILLNETEGSTNTTLRVYFYGFAPSERIEVRWHSGATSASSYSVIKTLTVAGNGRASSIVTIPAGTGVGSRLVVGKVVGVSRSASTPFEVTVGGAEVVGEATPTRTATATAKATATTEATATVEATPSQSPTPEPVAPETSTATTEPLPTETATPEATAEPNGSPVADAGDDQTVRDTDGAGDESVTLDGGGSADPEGGELSYGWTVDGVAVASGVGPTVTLPVGTTTVLLTVSDELGATATDEVVIVIEPGLADEAPAEETPAET